MFVFAGIFTATVAPHASASVLAPVWSHQSPAHTPAQGPMAFDPATGQLVLFGCDDQFCSTASTWTWDGSDWTKLSPAHTPFPRVGGAMAFDQADGEIVLFGGRDPLVIGGPFFSDTWTWDGADWTHQAPAHHPPGRTAASMAFDPRLSRMVLFGGDGGVPQFGGLGAFSDTWTWDGNDWTKVPTSIHPKAGAPVGASMAYDPATAQMVVFGSGGAAETWLWTGSTWKFANTAHVPPCPSGGAMAFDPAVGLVLMGGGTPPCPDPGIWIWDGSDWSELTATSPPPERTGSAADFDASTGSLVVFGGASSNGGTTLTDTWTLGQPGGARTWSNARPVDSPSARTAAAIAYDDATRQLLLFGGATPDPLDETWKWNGMGWVQLAPATIPPARSGEAMAFDPSAGNLVMFGGRGSTKLLADTWAWNGANWKKLTPATSPPARTGASMAFDASTGDLVLFGGTGSGGRLADTWSWNGSTWTNEAPAASPPARADASMLYDEAGGSLVLFGGAGTGGGAFSDTWSWDGSTWSQLAPAHSPPARSGASVSFDRVLGHTVLYGGLNGSGSPLADTWSWSGGDWSTITVGSSPSARSGAAAAFDPRSGDMLVFGGKGTHGLRSDTWMGPLKDQPIAPKVTSATGPATVSGAFVVTFDRPVHGVDATDVTVTEVGPQPVSGSMTCLDADGDPANCSAGPVTTARFKPTAPLIPGEYYFFNVNEGSTGVRDQYGAPVPFTSTYLRAQTVFLADQAPVNFGWGTVSNGAALGGTYVEEQFGGASEQYTFTGTSLDLVAWGGPDGGIAGVSITSAGSPPVTQNVDMYHASPGDETFSWPSLPSGSHTATITVTGTKAAASTGTVVRIDGFKVNGVSQPTPSLTARWAPIGGGDSSYRFTGHAGASVTLTYRGTSIVWTAFVGPNDGRADVTIDGNDLGTTDLYDPAFRFQDFTLSYQGMADTFHTVVITALGTHQASSTDSIVTVRQLSLT